ASALEAVEEIAALEDVDGLLMGPADLSNDLGVPLDLDSEPLRDAARRIGEAAAGSEKTAAIYMGAPEQAAAFRELGFTMFACTFESAVLAAGSAAAAAALKVS
ncbi:MAG TPA: aldolase/citrate lyase family protein, partial [Solirubrobacteraceae bacterium]|nr:aldolase/citrate lyase family protein [Solirubrobacteraceae bacterium]